jgi:hypothetical protein
MSNQEGVFEQLDGSRVIVSKDKGLWHLSISCPGKLPSYDQVKKARYKYLPDVKYAAQIFPPPEEFVNLHPFVLHVWELHPSEWKG